MTAATEAAGVRAPDTVVGRSTIGALARAEIRYTFEEIEGGGRVRIATSDPAALAAVHDFLRFQIEDHRTGDPLDVTP